ncbi:hypothetical protein HERIO_2011 [Hepatospora eriocheir]|nr:hypothetical protein HERIO_2011 [Hepatospora eriocheir]
MFNCKFRSLKEIMEELILTGVIDVEGNTIAKIDKKLKKPLIIILINFDFSFTDLQNLSSIKIIGTIENIDTPIDYELVEQYNFIFRDLTTFENYTEEIIDVDLFSSKSENALKVFHSVPLLSKKLFIELLILKNCFLNVLFDKIKYKMMISKKSKIKELLNEFIDHGIVKINDDDKIVLNLNKDDYKTLDKDKEIYELKNKINNV